MIICVDVGNTNICLGLYENDVLLNTYRLATNVNETYDEYGVKINGLFSLNGINACDIQGVIIGSVVPRIDTILEKMFKKYFNIEPLFVAPGVKSGIHIKIDNPKELGADLLVGAVAASGKYSTPVLVIDMGTATTFAYVNEKKEFLGGVICAGLKTSYNSLFMNTSKLEAVKLTNTNDILGKNTTSCLQNGMVYGTSSMIDGIISKFHKSYGDFTVVLTGGDAPFISKYLDEEVILDENLLLDGLNIIYKKNRV